MHPPVQFAIGGVQAGVKVHPMAEGLAGIVVVKNDAVALACRAVSALPGKGVGIQVVPAFPFIPGRQGENGPGELFFRHSEVPLKAERSVLPGDGLLGRVAQGFGGVAHGVHRIEHAFDREQKSKGDIDEGARFGREARAQLASQFPGGAEKIAPEDEVLPAQPRAHPAEQQHQPAGKHNREKIGHE